MKATPQEKKALSYHKDRRNRFGQSDKASRRLIPIRKAKGLRVARHAAAAITRNVASDFESDIAARAESKALKAELMRWEKAPDTKLKDVIQSKIEWRVRRYRRKKGAGVSEAKMHEDSEGILQKKNQPNKTIEPTPMLGSEQPSTGVAHL